MCDDKKKKCSGDCKNCKNTNKGDIIVKNKKDKVEIIFNEVKK